MQPLAKSLFDSCSRCLRVCYLDCFLDHHLTPKDPCGHSTKEVQVLAPWTPSSCRQPLPPTCTCTCTGHTCTCTFTCIIYLFKDNARRPPCKTQSPECPKIEWGSRLCPPRVDGARKCSPSGGGSGIHTPNRPFSGWRLQPQIISELDIGLLLSSFSKRRALVDRFLMHSLYVFQ